jgi:hypothetical protein
VSQSEAALGVGLDANLCIFDLHCVDVDGSEEEPPVVEGEGEVADLEEVRRGAPRKIGHCDVGRLESRARKKTQVELAPDPQLESDRLGEAVLDEAAVPLEGHPPHEYGDGDQESCDDEGGADQATSAAQAWLSEVPVTESPS